MVFLHMHFRYLGFFEHIHRDLIFRPLKVFPSHSCLLSIYVMWGLLDLIKFVIRVSDWTVRWITGADRTQVFGVFAYRMWSSDAHVCHCWWLCVHAADLFSLQSFDNPHLWTSARKSWCWITLKSKTWLESWLFLLKQKQRWLGSERCLVSEM